MVTKTELVKEFEKLSVQIEHVKEILNTTFKPEEKQEAKNPLRFYMIRLTLSLTSTFSIKSLPQGLTNSKKYVILVQGE